MTVFFSILRLALLSSVAGAAAVGLWAIALLDAAALIMLSALPRVLSGRRATLSYGDIVARYRENTLPAPAMFKPAPEADSEPDYPLEFHRAA